VRPTAVNKPSAITARETSPSQPKQTVADYVRCCELISGRAADGQISRFGALRVRGRLGSWPGLSVSPLVSSRRCPASCRTSVSQPTSRPRAWPPGRGSGSPPAPPPGPQGGQAGRLASVRGKRQLSYRIRYRPVHDRAEVGRRRTRGARTAAAPGRGQCARQRAGGQPGPPSDHGVHSPASGCLLSGGPRVPARRSKPGLELEEEEEEERPTVGNRRGWYVDGATIRASAAVPAPAAASSTSKGMLAAT
jgi:hypothetical protein